MTKRNRRAQAQAQHTTAAAPPPAPISTAPAQSFAFDLGDPEPVIGGRSALLEYAECLQSGDWYEPPVSLSALARLLRVGAHHESALRFKINVLASTFIPSPVLSAEAFSGFALDYMVLGNAYLERRRNRLGELLELRHALGKYTRRGLDMATYWWIAQPGQEQALPAGRVGHVMESDINQEIYGIPDYVGGLNSTLLNESATLFRRRYYENGSHAGFIMHITDAVQNEADITKLKEALRQSKGPGNFRNLLLYTPNGSKDGVKLIPVAEVAAKDDFLSIKNVSRDDQLATHRVPPQLMGVMPNSTGGFGDVTKAAQVFDINEIDSIKASLLALNDWAGEEIIRFNPYRLSDLTG